MNEHSFGNGNSVWNFAFQNGFGLYLSIKTAKNTTKTALNSSKQLTATGPWAYIREGLLSEGYLRLRFWGLNFGKAYLFIHLCIYLFISFSFFFLGGGGGGGEGAYYRNFPVVPK